MKKTNKIINTFLFVILGLIVVANLFILIQAKTNNNKVPAIFGYKPFIVMSGSMETNIYTGDLIFVKTINTNTLKENDIIAFRTEENAVVTHRIIEVLEDEEGIKYRTKGDNNPVEDADLVSPKDVEGKYVSKIPKLGEWLLFISKPIGLVVTLLAAIVVIFIYAFINMKIENKNIEIEDEQYRKEFEEFKKNNPHK